MLKEVALAGGVELAGGYARSCTRIPIASLDSVTSCSGAGFADAETNPRQRESRRRNGKGWSVNSVIATCVRRDDGGGLMPLVKPSQAADAREGY